MQIEKLVSSCSRMHSETKPLRGIGKILSASAAAYLFVVSCGTLTRNERTDQATVKTESIAVVPLRKNESEIKTFAEKNNYTFIQSSTIEFGNGNTFVRLQDNVHGLHTAVAISNSLSATDLIETLIKVRTLRTNGAAWIDVLVSGKTRNVAIHLSDGTPINIDLRWLFATAGADRIVDRESEVQSEQLPHAQFLRYSDTSRSSSTSKTFLISNVSNSSVVRHLQRKLGLEVATPETIPAGRNAAAVYVLSNPSNDAIVRSLSDLMKLNERGIRVHLITPYLPYARSDKIDQPGITVTGRLIADLLECTGISSVAFVRPHAPQSQGFFGIPSQQITGRPTINHYLKRTNVDVIVAPDAGAQKDATLYANEIGVPVAVINKQRDPLTSQTRIVGISGASVAGKTVAIIDDETATGGTQAQAAQMLKDAGAKKVIGVVTHLAGDAKAAVESDALDALVITDTIPVNMRHPKLRVLRIASELVQHVRKLTTERLLRSHVIQKRKPLLP